MKTTPSCPVHLTANRLEGADGYAVESTPATDGRGYTLRGSSAVVERRRLAVVYSCPSCEWAHVAGADLTTVVDSTR